MPTSFSAPRRQALLLTLSSTLPGWALGPAGGEHRRHRLAHPSPCACWWVFPGGSSPDLVARILAEPLSKALAQPVVVDNRPGASGNIAADMVARATDQHTLGVMINGNLTIAKLLNAKTPYDPAKDLAPISLVATAPLVLCVPAPCAGDHGTGVAGCRARRRQPLELRQSRRGHGGPYRHGTAQQQCRLGRVHIPYPGNPQVITAMVGRPRCSWPCCRRAWRWAPVRAGKLRAIGLTSAGRSTLVPELPSPG